MAILLHLSANLSETYRSQCKSSTTRHKICIEEYNQLPPHFVQIFKDTEASFFNIALKSSDWRAQWGQFPTHVDIPEPVNIQSGAALIAGFSPVHSNIEHLCSSLKNKQWRALRSLLSTEMCTFLKEDNRPLLVNFLGSQQANNNESYYFNPCMPILADYYPCGGYCVESVYAWIKFLESSKADALLPLLVKLKYPWFSLNVHSTFERSPSMHSATIGISIRISLLLIPKADPTHKEFVEMLISQVKAESESDFRFEMIVLSPSRGTLSTTPLPMIGESRPIIEASRNIFDSRSLKIRMVMQIKNPHDRAVDVLVTELVPVFYDIHFHSYKYNVGDGMASQYGCIEYNNDTSKDTTNDCNQNQNRHEVFPPVATRYVAEQPSFRYSRNSKKCKYHRCKEALSCILSSSNSTMSCEAGDELLETYDSVSFRLILPANSTANLWFTAEKKFLRRELQPPDASRGLEVPPAILVSSWFSDHHAHHSFQGLECGDVKDRIDCRFSNLFEQGKVLTGRELSPDPMVMFITGTAVVTMPIPDLSMPFIVITLVGTAAAFLLGSMINALVRSSNKKIEKDPLT